MAKFEIAYAKTARNEGGYVNNPNDRGGETYNGISRKFWPNWEGWKIVDVNKKDPRLHEMEAEFYELNFWFPMRFGLIESQEIANELYDTAVNMGLDVAARFLQEALNLLNRQGKDYPELKVDGKIGPVTRAAVNNHPRKGVLLRMLNLLQGEKYLNIVRRDPSQEEFLNGWVNTRITV